MRPLRSKNRSKANARRGGRAGTIVRSSELRAFFDGRQRAGGSVWRLMGALGGNAMLRRPMLALTLLFILGAGGAGLVAGGYVAGAYSVFAGSALNGFTQMGFAVSHIALKGNKRTPADAVYAALGIRQGDSIFTVDPEAARARLLKLPWVADAEVRRQFPDTVSIVIVEKRPFALWQGPAAGRLAVVERSGAVIIQTGSGEFARLPLLVGAGAPQAAAPLIDAIGLNHTVAARLKAAVRVSERRWDLLLDNGVTVKLPEQGWEHEIATLEKLIVEQGILERDIEIIDLRYPDSYIFRLHNGDSQPASWERPA